MTRKQPRDVAASVRQRLMNLARARKEDFGLVLTRYALERLLYRLSQSPHRDGFLLKGALLFQLWSPELHRPTRDLDLLGQGACTVDRLESVLRDICRQSVPEDGLHFLESSVRGEPIKEDQEYQGLRLHCEARLGNARISLQIDIGSGDAVTPGPVEIAYPTLLDFPAPTLHAYPRETVVAEKFQALVMLGMGNSRMKDFYNLWILAQRLAFTGVTLAQAIHATFQSRRTNLPTQAPLALSAEFWSDRTKISQWIAFFRKSSLDAEGAGLDQVILFLRDFLMPPSIALAAGETFARVWRAGGPWKPAEEPTG